MRSEMILNCSLNCASHTVMFTSLHFTSHDPSLDSWAMGPPLPRAVRGCWATVRAGEIHVGYQDDPGRVFMYRGGAWEEHAAELDIEGAAACNPIILG